MKKTTNWGETGGVVQYGCNLLSRANVAGNHVIEGKTLQSGNEHEK